MAKSQWLIDKERQEIAQRKAAQQKTHDPVFEQCVIAYINWRKDGNQGSFDLFKRDWYQGRGNPA
jgi:hypothetical protein